jgi:hypothetical protein
MTDDFILIAPAGPGRPTRVRRPAAWYAEQAVLAIRKLLEAEHAVVWHEIEAKISDGLVGTKYSTTTIDPHHLTNARKTMMDSGEIRMTTEVTRGGGAIAVYSFVNDFKIKEQIKKAARRKRLLEARYLGWARGSRDIKLIGDAGELALHNVLKAAAVSQGYQITQGERRFGNVERLFGDLVPGGSLDNVAHLIADIDTAPTVVTVLCEVKNLRSWLYPSSEEVYQLLEKAARLQIAYPNRNFVPVLICRRSHFLLRLMAKHLGFRVGNFQHGEQPIMRSSLYLPEELAEVRDTLGYALSPIEGDFVRPELLGFFEKVIPPAATEAAERWKLMAPALVDQFAALRGEQLHGQGREAALDELARIAHEVIPEEGLIWRSIGIDDDGPAPW